MSVDEKWFNDQLTARDLSQRGLAKLMGLKPSTVNRMFRGTRRWQLDDVRLVAEILGAPAAEISARAGVEMPAESTAAIAITGVADAKGTIGGLKAGMGRRAERPPMLPDTAHAIRWVAPGLPVDGWVAYFIPAAKVEPEAVGRLSIVQLANKGGRHLAVLLRGYAAGKWNLRSLADASAELADVDIESAAPVVWIKA